MSIPFFQRFWYRASGYTVVALICLAHAGQAQQVICENTLDRAAVKKKAKRLGVRFDHPSWFSGIGYHKEACEWEAWSAKTRHTNWGDCKHTNGCTVQKTITVKLDAATGKLKSRKKKRSKYPNYE